MNTRLDFRKLAKASRKVKITDTLTSLKIAVMGNHALQFFSSALRNQLLLLGINPEIYEVGYNQIDIELIDADSKIYKFKPDVVIFFESTFSIQNGFYKLDSDLKRMNFAKATIDKIEQRIKYFDGKTFLPKIIYYSYELVDDNVFGNYFANVQSSFYYQLFQFNAKLLQLTEKFHNLYIFEINKYLKQVKDTRNWTNVVVSDIHFSLDQFAYLAFHNAKMLSTFSGQFKKCIILDLDNTLWGGIIGDDEIDNIEIGNLGIGKAFTRLQIWLKELQKRGIILAVCSKNEEKIAKLPFEKHPEMVLKLEDISIFVANWNNKADNIRYIQKVLNIGFDSMVFLDDNPIERDLVRQEIPEITVPELPKDPVDYYHFLVELNLFDTVSYSKNDQNRTLQYQQEALRMKAIPSLTNMNEYLESLKMVGEIEAFQEHDVARIAQLTQRSNQFNLRTIRYDTDDILRIMKSSDFLTFSIKLKDKFGDYGLISVIILEKNGQNKYKIDTWIMSCRVLKKGVEFFALNYILKTLKEIGATTLDGEYLATKKNVPVKNLLQDLGFSKKENGYSELSVVKFKNIRNFIQQNK